jgi:Leucine-rich repeat (LRR) protein
MSPPTLPMRPFRLALLVPAIALASACADYAVTFNDRAIYTPPALFSDYRLADDALRACVTQHIIDQAATAAEGLELLDCSHAGIEDLAGLEVFTGLTRVRLSGNAIGDASPLAAATGLEILILADNRIADAAPLLTLENLARLDLSGNDQLACPLEEHTIDDLTLPAHCGA